MGAIDAAAKHGKKWGDITLNRPKQMSNTGPLVEHAKFTHRAHDVAFHCTGSGMMIATKPRFVSTVRSHTVCLQCGEQYRINWQQEEVRRNGEVK